MPEEQPIGCGIAFTTLFVCTAIFVVILLALLGPAIGNVFSNVIDGLQ